jgi:biotin carboxyl carrier protein
VAENRLTGQQASGQRDGGPAAVTPLGDGWYSIRDGEQSWRVAAAHDANGTWLFFAGRVAYVERDGHGGRGRRAKGRGESSVMAPMPATVISINTAVGQSVSEGDTVIVLEAMKMELPIRAPRTGVVTAIHCAKGELVQPGVNLLELDA